jgi:predicted RNA-binding protein with PIN domain
MASQPERTPEQKAAQLREANFTNEQAQAIVMVLSDLATQRQVDALSAEVQSLRAELHQGIEGVRAELHQGIEGVRTELRQEIEGVRTELHREIGSLWWKLSSVLVLQAGLIVSLIKLI